MNRPNFLLSPKQWPFFYGWVILLFGTIGLLMSAPGQTIGVSAFTDSLLTALSLSRDELSLAYMGGTMLSAVLLTKAGQFYDRFGAVKTAMIASIGLGLALIYMSQIDKLSQAMGSTPLVTMVMILGGFIFLRFFGQGVLTLCSRTMVVNWFDVRRGLAVGALGVVASYGFSVAPMVFDGLINKYDWSTAWIILAVCIGLIFPVFILVFFKEAPEVYGVLPDGFSKTKNEQKISRFPVVKNYNLSEARRMFSFWVLCAYPAMFGLFTTGFTFHVVSIFGEQSISREIAIHIFQPIAIASIASTIFCSILSDYVKIKYLAFYMGIMSCIAIIGLFQLQAEGIYYWLMILGYGGATGSHSIFLSIFLPRYFGRQHLGAITGQAMTLVVFASAIGPILFSLSLSVFSQYNVAVLICGLAYLVLLICTFFIYNPQETLGIKNDQPNII